MAPRNAPETPAPETPPLAFGVPEGPYLEGTSEEGLRHFRQTCDRLIRAGCQIQSFEMLMDFPEIAERHFTLVAAEAALVHRVVSHLW